MMDFLSGAMMLASFVSAVFFYRFWSKTRDLFFLYFTLTFFLLGVERIMLAIVDYGAEHRPYAYLIRLVAFTVILVAIIQKNRAEAPRKRFVESEA